MSIKRFITILFVTGFILALIPFSVGAKGGRPGGGETTVGNNLSYPVLAIDGFAITPLGTPALTASYTGSYPGLTADEITYLQANGPWYAQKTTGNTWQAEYANTGNVDVTYIDWSDNMESVNPKIRAPFRIEMVLFKALDVPMTAYNMAVLEYPSSADELQGTNGLTYESNYATVVSSKPLLVVQYLGSAVPEGLTWQGTQWSSGTVVPVSFAPELNVGGKYVYGASQGGWKPTSLGYYRITFYVPTGSGLNLSLGTIANASTGFTAPTEGVATAVVDPVNNLTYMDVLVKASGGRK